MDINTRVQIPSHIDQWMMGDRFGNVETIVNHPSGTVARVRLDKSQTAIFFSVKDLTPVQWIG